MISLSLSFVSPAGFAARQSNIYSFWPQLSSSASQCPRHTFTLTCKFYHSYSRFVSVKKFVARPISFHALSPSCSNAFNSLAVEDSIAASSDGAGEFYESGSQVSHVMTEETDADQLDDEVEYADAIESELPEDEDQPVKVSSRLTPRQRKFLRSTAAMAGKRIPCVQVGKLGLSDSLFRSADEALEANELIKLKVSGNSDVSLGEAAQAISASCGADIAHMIGSCALLYRQSDSRPTLQLPGAPSIPARTVIVPAPRRVRSPPTRSSRRQVSRGYHRR